MKHGTIVTVTEALILRPYTTVSHSRQVRS